mmetsp:Transcript_31031/g.84129  ORF Transcript_31031/g.84129 Transcript_31031/m.84129 type:complete len:207 (-) Transcript_31031:615-1235(-)
MVAAIRPSPPVELVAPPDVAPHEARPVKRTPLLEAAHVHHGRRRRGWRRRRGRGLRHGRRRIIGAGVDQRVWGVLNVRELADGAPLHHDLEHVVGPPRRVLAEEERRHARHVRAGHRGAAHVARPCVAVVLRGLDVRAWGENVHALPLITVPRAGVGVGGGGDGNGTAYEGRRVLASVGAIGRPFIARCHDDGYSACDGLVYGDLD